jgi:hypothetical protein
MGDRKLKAYQGNFGQQRAARYSMFAGVLEDKRFRAERVGPSRAGLAPGLLRTRAGYKHKGGMSTEQKARIQDQESTIADKQGGIDELQGQLDNIKPEPPAESPALIFPDESMLD